MELIIKPRKLQHNKKKRSLEGNESICQLLDEQFEKVYKFTPFKQIYSQIIQEIKGQRCSPKEFFKDKLTMSQTIIIVETNYGTLTINSGISNFSINVATLEQALEMMKIDLNQLQNDVRITGVVEMNMNAAKQCKENLKMLEELTKQKIQLQKDCEIYCEEGEYTDEQKHYIKLIASRNEFLRMYSLYIQERGKACRIIREIFKKGVINGNFPLSYTYREITISFNKIGKCLTKQQMVYYYLTDLDKKDNSNKWDEYILNCLIIASDNKKYHLNYMLNDIDYSVIEDNE